MKKRVGICLLLFCTGTVLTEPQKEAPLTDPLLKGLDGLPGLMDKAEVGRLFWAIQEIKALHKGSIRVSAQGVADSSRSSTVFPLIFRNEQQTIKTLIELEKQMSHFSPQERAEFMKLFTMVKAYFGIVNDLLRENARGAEDIMIKLIQEFCRKRNRPNSLLLNWKKGSSESEVYNNTVKSFRVLHVLSTDLMNFLADLAMSCPKALKSYQDSIKKGTK